MKNLVFWYFDEQWFTEKEPYKNMTDDYKRTKRKKNNVNSKRRDNEKITIESPNFGL